MFRKGHRVGEVKKWETDLRALKKKEVGKYDQNTLHENLKGIGYQY